MNFQAEKGFEKHRNCGRIISVMRDPELLRRGRRLGPFTLLERLAMGGMAEIWSSEAPGGLPVALKILKPHLSSDREFRAMFADEVNIARRLRHENIVRVHDGRFESGHFFLVMDLVEGLDLRRILSKLAHHRQWLPAPLALAIGRGMARALAYAHLRKDGRGQGLEIVHRDISPHNVMLTLSGVVKLLDFGIAKTRERHARTRPGVIKGKAGYMAPEQAIGAPMDHRTDIFATGIVLWEALAMRRLFSASNEIETLDRVISAHVPPLREINEAVPVEAAELIHWMLARSPKNRPSTMVDVELGFRRVLVRSYEPEVYSSARMGEWLQGLLKRSPQRVATAVEGTATISDEAPTKPN